ncbi:hypothetical protein ASPZODRAFT_134169 [Penicilliopsis zonata CBS 506.65]|uniref:Asparaginase n=1 Tax=Penicilliopsis zonata CBS 506.65 TaxID=1073090 RepID=A0A1L9SE57_9EURO|nr:hypothetical protein ASPZODRAFT_134169 [Penicilliopsis zonata CBS 506.65]OJJ45496.1 hypothetical protein ASPZODRAFT_134169 [Penicilliopsis zonata CBS 506.65]
MPSPTFKPALILHGGAGGIHRSTLPPSLYAAYHASLLSYLRSTDELLKQGATALDAAVHAVSLMEDDELFNCGRGSVFTTAGTIEMEASVMVTSVHPEHIQEEQPGGIKRGAGVMGVKNVRHPIQLARESLLRTGYDVDGIPNSDGGNMHSQTVGPFVEELARDWGLEFMPDEWFWTQRRWDEHLRGLRGEKEAITMSQGTVGCVCLDQWGGLAVATSTGGLTNKTPGRIGDTPTLGAGFWAEAFDSDYQVATEAGMAYRPCDFGNRSREASPTTTAAAASRWYLAEAQSLFGDCLPSFLRDAPPPAYYTARPVPPSSSYSAEKQPAVRTRRKAIAMSGTGNGDSFLRTAAVRSAAAMLRFSAPSSSPMSLAEAVTAVAGPGGELQRSAGRRWGKTGEGMGGIIGIEAEAEQDIAHSSTAGAGPRCRRGKVVFDFNCGGMWRAWKEEDENGEEIERVMVFRDEY